MQGTSGISAFSCNSLWYKTAVWNKAIDGSVPPWFTSFAHFLTRVISINGGKNSSQCGYCYS